MDRLKDFIDRHREEFDSENLPEGHLERFEQKINKRKRTFVKFIAPLAVVAAAACIAAIVFLQDSGTDVKPARATVFICEADEEMDGLREYYNMQLYDIEDRIERLYNDRPSPVAHELMAESKQVVENVYEFEETILPALPCSDDGLSVINRQYESSLQSLNFMLDQMEKIVNEEEFYN